MFQKMTLPDHDELMRRLTAMDNDLWFASRIYPVVASALVGKTLAGPGIANAIMLAAAGNSDLATVVTLPMNGLTDMVSAIIGHDDEVVLREAVAHSENILARLRG
jgi:hypothetical protein